MRRAIRNALSCAILLCASSAFAAPGDTLFFDDFERNNLSSRWSRTHGGSAGLGNQTSNSGRRSLYIGERANVVTSLGLSFGGIDGADLSIWIRRGEDIFSEDPDPSEDLVVEYLASDNNYYEIQTYTGAGTPGEVFNLQYSLPPDALHGNFRLRFRLLAGSGNNLDYFHIDDIHLIETSNLPPTTTPPLAVGVCDNFESGSLPNWTETGPGQARVDTLTANSPTRSMSISEGRSVVTSVPFDTTTGISTVSAWIRRGSDTFSENPDRNENLYVEFLDNAGDWIRIGTFPGGGTPGEVFQPSFALPASAAHAAFQLRFILAHATGRDLDYWHIDDVCFLAGTPLLSIRSDATPPTARSTETVTYTITVENSSSSDGANVVVTEEVSPYAAFALNGFGPGIPFAMTEGAIPSGLAMGAVSYSNDDAGSYSHPPTSGGGGAPSGYDGLITNWRLPFTGTMPAGSSFTLQYQVQVE
jgi:uncharacterized repeat protein (TIGR01451 family)